MWCVCSPLRVLGYYVTICPLGAFGEISSFQFLFWDPLYISETNGAKTLKFGGRHLKATCKNLFARGRLGRSAAPAFYFGTPYISQKLMELGS